MICDFCSAPGPKWRFPAKTFLDKESLTESVEDWMSCDACAALICNDDYQMLAKRALLAPMIREAIRSEGNSAREMFLAAAIRIHKNFAQNRTGEPVRI